MANTCVLTDDGNVACGKELSKKAKKDLLRFQARQAYSRRKNRKESSEATYEVEREMPHLTGIDKFIEIQKRMGITLSPEKEAEMRRFRL